MGKQMVPYGQLLDEFGTSIQKEIGIIKPGGLKPAIMSDIMRTYGAIYGIQQLMVIFYNLHVQNYEKLMQKLAEQGNEIESLKTRCATYTEKINELERKEKDLGGAVIRIVLDNIKSNGSVRAKILEIVAGDVAKS